MAQRRAQRSAQRSVFGQHHAGAIAAAAPPIARAAAITRQTLRAMQQDAQRCGTADAHAAQRRRRCLLAILPCHLPPPPLPIRRCPRPRVPPPRAPPMRPATRTPRHVADAPLCRFAGCQIDIAPGAMLAAASAAAFAAVTACRQPSCRAGSSARCADAADGSHAAPRFSRRQMMLSPPYAFERY